MSGAPQDQEQANGSAPAEAAPTPAAAAADVTMTDGTNADQAAKRQRTTDSEPTSSAAAASSSDATITDATAGSSTTAAAATSAAPASSSAPAAVAPTLTPAQLAEIKLNLTRYVKQLSVGCGVATCSNRECVTGGATPLSGAALLNKAKQLYSTKVPCCVPVPSSSSTLAPPTATASASAHVSTPARPAAPAAPSAAAASTPAPTFAASSFVTPARPSFGAAQTPESSLAPPMPVRRRSPPSAASSSPAAAAAASSSSSAPSASPALSPQPSPRISPSLSQMLAEATPTLPVKSQEAPITDVVEWVSALDAARTEWEAKGSPANDIALFRPMMNRAYKVFNELNCLNLSFRIKKDDLDRENDKARVQHAEKERADAQAEAEAVPKAEPAAPESKEDVESAMTDIPPPLKLSPPAVPSAASSKVAEVAAATLAASVASEFVEATETSPAIDYASLDSFYESISSVCIEQADGTEYRPILNSLMNGFRSLLNELTMRPLTTHQLHPMLLRAIPIMYENAMWFDPGHYDTLKLVCKFMSMLPRAAKKLVVSWMTDVERWTPDTTAVTPMAHRARWYSLDRLERLLGALQQFISVRIFDKQDLRDVAPAVVFISCIDEANETFAQWLRVIPLAVPKTARTPQPIDVMLFYNDAVNECVDLKVDFRRWVQQLRSGAAASTDFSFFKYNFILDAGSKANLLKYDSQMQQHAQYRDSMIASGMDQRAGYLILEVRRTHLIEDTMRALSNKTPAEYKKPIKIHFQGEKGIDAGGLRKEFFSLLLAELFDARYGMFLTDDETRTFQFNPDSLDSPLEFELIGVLIGLAVFSSTILDLHLPRVYYKRLLGGKPTLDDLMAAQPALAKGLMQLLEFDGDVESTFSRDFTITRESYGAQIIVELKPDGANIPVTNENRHEFVDLYVDYLLVRSIEKQFGAFNKGFHRACGGEALKLFRPFELELLVCGISELDFEALESTTRYEDGYDAQSPIIKQFWEIVHQELTLDERKKLLEFCTGSDRVPIRGLASMHLTISKQGPDSPQLPTSHTCFNHLLLPAYETKEKLRTLLRLALQNSKGFGLI